MRRKLRGVKAVRLIQRVTFFDTHGVWLTRTARTAGMPASDRRHIYCSSNPKGASAILGPGRRRQAFRILSWQGIGGELDPFRHRLIGRGSAVFPALAVLLDNPIDDHIGRTVEAARHDDRPVTRPAHRHIVIRSAAGQPEPMRLRLVQIDRRQAGQRRKRRRPAVSDGLVPCLAETRVLAPLGVEGRQRHVGQGGGLRGRPALGKGGEEACLLGVAVGYGWRGHERTPGLPASYGEPSPGPPQSKRL